MSEHITHIPQVRRLERPTSGRVLAGVCAGLGRYFDLSPAAFRLGFIVLTLLGGAGVLVYLAAVVVVPEEGKERSLAEQVIAERRDRPMPLVALAVAGVAAIVLLSHVTIWPAAAGGWVVLLVAGLVVLWASRGERRASRLIRLAIGLVALVLAIAVAALVAAFAWLHVDLGSGVGKRSVVATSPAQVSPSYHLGVGNLTLDLSALPATSRLAVRARVDVGKLRIVVPAGARLTVNARAKVGEVRVLGQEQSGENATVDTGAGSLALTARVGAGRVEVVRAR